MKREEANTILYKMSTFLDNNQMSSSKNRSSGTKMRTASQRSTCSPKQETSVLSTFLHLYGSRRLIITELSTAFS